MEVEGINLRYTLIDIYLKYKNLGYKVVANTCLEHPVTKELISIPYFIDLKDGGYEIDDNLNITNEFTLDGEYDFNAIGVEIPNRGDFWINIMSAQLHNPAYRHVCNFMSIQNYLIDNGAVIADPLKYNYNLVYSKFNDNNFNSDLTKLDFIPELKGLSIIEIREKLRSIVVKNN